jgi:hypothetical protein
MNACSATYLTSLVGVVLYVLVPPSKPVELARAAPRRVGIRHKRLAPILQRLSAEMSYASTSRSSHRRGECCIAG